MVHQLVLGLEGLLLPGALLPVAGVVRDFRSAHMVNCQVGHNLVHRVEDLAADLFGVPVNPLAGCLLLPAAQHGRRLAHVAEEGRALHVGAVHVVGVVAGVAVLRHVVKEQRVGEHGVVGGEGAVAAHVLHGGHRSHGRHGRRGRTRRHHVAAAARLLVIRRG